MPLEMAALCLNTSLETIQPLCYCCALGGSLPLLSQAISSDCPGCDAIGKPCPPKQLTIYSPGA